MKIKSKEMLLLKIGVALGYRGLKVIQLKHTSNDFSYAWSISEVRMAQDIRRELTLTKKERMILAFNIRSGRSSARNEIG